MINKATARAGSNIAFIKYWGVQPGPLGELHVPLNNSISLTLADAYTLTTVEWDEGLASDDITLDEVRLGERAAARISEHLDRIRALAGDARRARVVSRNNFPTASGIASSASGFAALSVAGAAAMGLDLGPADLSRLARLGSGSASRSLFGGFVEWQQGVDHETSVAHELFPAAHWALCDVVAIVSSAEKQTSSKAGHRLAASSPLNDARVAGLKAPGGGLDEVREAIAARDLSRLGPAIERDALAMHAVMMTGRPSLLYWQPATLELLHAVPQWRAEGIKVYFTIDAGPNVHLICETAAVEDVRERLAALPSVQRVLVSGAGEAATLEGAHLF